MEETPARVNKTPQAKINKSIARYHAHKDDLLKMAALKNICEHGRMPFQTTIVKHNLAWEDIANCLQSYIKDHPVIDGDQRQRVIDDKREIREFHRFISSNRNQGNRDDDLTILNKVFINAHQCAMCKTPFMGKRKIMNADEVNGLIRFVLCVPCSIGAVKEDTEVLQEEIQKIVEVQEPQELVTKKVRVKKVQAEKLQAETFS